MSALRHCADSVVRSGRYPVLTAERLFAIERSAAELGARRMPAREPIAALADRAAAEGTATLADAELRRLVDELWSGRRPAALAAGIVEGTLARHSRSCDRALIHAYLRRYPIAHAAFEVLRHAAATAAARHDWAWRANGARWRLWERDGPATVAKAFDEGQATLAGMGFTGALARSLFLTTIEQVPRADGC